MVMTSFKISVGQSNFFCKINKDGFEGLSKKTTCLLGLAAMGPYKVAQSKLILASSTIIYDRLRAKQRRRTAKINFFRENVGVSENSISKYHY